MSDHDEPLRDQTRLFRMNLIVYSLPLVKSKTITTGSANWSRYCPRRCSKQRLKISRGPSPMSAAKTGPDTETIIKNESWSPGPGVWSSFHHWLWSNRRDAWPGGAIWRWWHWRKRIFRLRNLSPFFRKSFTLSYSGGFPIVKERIFTLLLTQPISNRVVTIFQILINKYKHCFPT